jgi:hypothetical protein
VDRLRIRHPTVQGQPARFGKADLAPLESRSSVSEPMGNASRVKQGLYMARRRALSHAISAHISKRIESRTVRRRV